MAESKRTNMDATMEFVSKTNKRILVRVADIYSGKETPETIEAKFAALGKAHKISVRGYPSVTSLLNYDADGERIPASPIIFFNAYWRARIENVRDICIAQGGIV